jgi:hypothetical protein
VLHGGALPGWSLIPDPGCTDRKSEGGTAGGAKNDFDHEGVRAGGREPPDDLQLAVGSVRIFVDTLWRDPHHADRPAVDSVWETEGRNQA